jgi:hypothetical protein
MKKTFAVFGVAIAFMMLTACQGSPVGNMMRSERQKTLADTMQGWVGKNESELMAAWGAPTSSYQSKDGSVVATWKESSIVHDNSSSTGYKTRNCVKTFLVDAEGVLSKWKYEHCPRYVAGTLPAGTPIPEPSL